MQLEWLPFALFFGFLVVFHALAFYVRWTRRTWFFLEYFWLGVAVLALLTLAVDLAGIAAGGRLGFERGWLDSSREHLISIADTFAGWYEPDGLFSWQAEEQPYGRWYSEFSAWSRDVEAAANTEDYQELSRLQLAGPDAPTEPSELSTLHQEKPRIHRAIQEVLDRADRVQDLELRIQGIPYTGWYLGLSVFLLPPALALATSKVTAEIFGWIPG